MLFSVGIDQSYAQSLGFLVLPTPEFDFATSGDVVRAGCLTDAALVATGTGVSGTLGGPSSETCFQGDRTWQAFILNAGTDNDILDSTPSATASGTDMHAISFDDLDPETTYRAVLLLTGEYRSIPGGTFSDISVYRIVEFMTTELPPVASDHTIEVLEGSSETLTIPFEELVVLPANHTFEELVITFGPLSAAITGASPMYAGTTTTTPDSTTNLLTVEGTIANTADVVTITSTLSANDDIVIPYTITNKNGLSDSGMITFDFVDYIAPLIAVPYTLDPALTDLSGLPTIMISIPQSVILSDFITGTQLISSIPASDITIIATNPGNASGTLTVTPPSGTDNFIFSYTPTMFDVTETFSYAATFRGDTATSELHIAVPPDFAPDSTITAGFGTAGTLTIPLSTIVDLPSGSTYDTSTITFTLGMGTSSSFSEFTGFEGATPSGALTAADDVLTVGANTVVITTGFDSTDNDDLLFNYTATLDSGVADSGVITITFPVDPTVTTNTHTVTLTDLSDLPTIDLPISLMDVTDILLAGTDISDNNLVGLRFGSNGTGGSVTGGVGFETGSKGGILTTTNPSAATADDPAVPVPLFHYTPFVDSDGDVFVGTEAFEYSVSRADSATSTSTLFIVTPTLVCDKSMIVDIDFGDVAVRSLTDESSMNIMNTGNTDNQLMIRGDAWLSDADSEPVMNVNQTKYALMPGLNYADDVTDHTVNDGDDTNNKISFTASVANIGPELGISDSLTAYLQFKADLIDISFRGGTTQDWTVTSLCE